MVKKTKPKSPAVWRFPTSAGVEAAKAAEAEKASLPKARRRERLTKAQVQALKPGTWIELAWNDSANTVALLLERAGREKGDVSLKCFFPDTGAVSSQAVHTQVVCVHGELQVPQLDDDWDEDD